MSFPRGGWAASILAMGIATVVACGGSDATTGNPGNGTGDDGGGGGGGDGSPPPPVTVTSCAPSGMGKDYQVGPGAGQLASLDLVPWESLAAGDTVRIFYRAAPYAGKFVISAKGTAAAPVRVCGVKGPNGERPIIDGSGATTRAALSPVYGDKASDRAVFEPASIVLIKNDGTNAPDDFPAFVQVDGLAIRRGHPDYAFKDDTGATLHYDAFSACVWIQRGHDITIADNEISDCAQAIFSTSKDDGDATVTRNVRIAQNSMFDCGIAGDEHMHTTYTASAGIVYELNHFGPVRAGAGGNSIKDRSAGTVVRFNRIDDGAHAIDLVEAEDFPMTATADPAYRTTFVYGNQIKKSGDTGSFIHYGGDHYGSTPGSNWGEPWFRKGTLYFFSNTVVATDGSADIFQLSTTEEHAEVFDNVFVFANSGGRHLRTSTDGLGSNWTPGGIVNLGRNWVSDGWTDQGVPGQMNGPMNLLVGAASPIDATTFVPLAGSAIVDAAQPGPAAVAPYKVDRELDPTFKPKPRPVDGAAPDLGAVEL